MPILQMRGIAKRFGEIVANDHIDFEVEPNEIHALLGENGAGKSTLMKVLYGLYQPDEGEIHLDGQPVAFKSPLDAIARGVGFVSQHFSLVPTFTVAENVALGFEGSRLFERRRMNRVVAETAERYGLSIDPQAVVRDLSVGQQQRVEILKALYRDCRILILDEPTAVLTPRDAESLFNVLRELQREQLSVIIITHKLEEVMQISQRVTVLRHGKVVGQVDTAQTDVQMLARMLVGRDAVTTTMLRRMLVRSEVVTTARSVEPESSEAVALDVRDVSLVDKRGVPVLSQVWLHVRAGEIVGVAGVAGNGQAELVAVLSGLLTARTGDVRVNGQRIPTGEPRHFSRAGVARIPEDRLKGVIPDLTVAENLALEQIDDFVRAGHLDHRAMRDRAERLIWDFQIKAKPGDRVRTLSGGNIQKVILARTLSREPVAVVASQPTRGLDVGATEYVHQKLLEQKQRGAGVLLVSEDLDEILLLSDRILVIYQGQIIGEFARDEVDLDKLSLLMAGSKTPEAEARSLER